MNTITFITKSAFLLLILTSYSCDNTNNQKTKKNSTTRQSQPPNPTTNPTPNPNNNNPNNSNNNNNNSNQPNNNTPESKIDIIINHQTKRFQTLDIIMQKNAKYEYHILFPGQSAKKHALGTGIAAGGWGGKTNANYIKMNTHITSEIKKLENKYKNRIHFGFIGDYEFEPSSRDCNRSKANTKSNLPGKQTTNNQFWIHVWGANDGNFNYPNNHEGSWGAGQATCFEKQRPGVFGISTMPPSIESKDRLMADDKLLSSYE